MITLETHNCTDAASELHNPDEIARVMEQWIRTRSVPATYLSAVLGGSTDRPFDHILRPGGMQLGMTGSNFSAIAEQMAADPFFVAETEKGWSAIDEGRFSDLDTIRRRLGDL